MNRSYLVGRCLVAVLFAGASVFLYACAETRAECLQRANNDYNACLTKVQGWYDDAITRDAGKRTTCRAAADTAKSNCYVQAYVDCPNDADLEACLAVKKAACDATRTAAYATCNQDYADREASDGNSLVGWRAQCSTEFNDKVYACPPE